MISDAVVYVSCDGEHHGPCRAVFTADLFDSQDAPGIYDASDAEIEIKAKGWSSGEDGQHYCDDCTQRRAQRPPAGEESQ